MYIESKVGHKWAILTTWNRHLFQPGIVDYTSYEIDLVTTVIAWHLIWQGAMTDHGFLNHASKNERDLYLGCFQTEPLINMDQSKWPHVGYSKCTLLRHIMNGDDESTLEKARDSDLCSRRCCDDWIDCGQGLGLTINMWIIRLFQDSHDQHNTLAIRIHLPDLNAAQSIG